jgi:aminopeptidase N
MKINFVVTISLIFGMLSSCNSKAENKSASEDKNLIIDTHTLSNYKDLPIKNTHLELSVNFQEKKIKGSATHQFDKNRKVDLLKLDTKYLKIDSIQDGDGNSLEYSIGEFDELLGSALTVILNSESNEVVIFYETTDKSEALDWLLPNQTAGKTFPFMYTQGQSIFTRSWIPIQDTPGIRITYTAKINTPKNMMAVMSAANPQKNGHQ